MSDDGPGTREVAQRLFAAEFDDASLSYSESDEERAPNYVVTPTGARVNRLFVAGVLTEVERINDDTSRGRIVDPSGAFVTYAGQYQPTEAAFLERADPPTFVALTGKARTFEPEDSDRVFTSVRPESLNEVDADVRDRWVVSAAEATLDRLATFAAALDSDLRGEELRTALEAGGATASLAAGIPKAIDHYDTTTGYVEAIRRLAVDALELIAGDRETVRAPDIAPHEGTETAIGALPETAVTIEPPAESETEPEAKPPTEAGTETEPEDHPVATAEAGEDSRPIDADRDTESRPDPATTAADAIDTSGADTAETGEAEADMAEADTAETATAEADDPGTDPDDGAGTLGDFDAGDVDAGDVDTGTSDTAAEFDEVTEFDEATGSDEVFELDETEREEIESEFGTDFATGREVDDPGEADIDVPEPDETTEPAPEEATSSPDGTVDAETDEAAADADLEDAVVEAMTALDDGDGADREAVVETVVDDHGVTADAAEDAIQDALMSGKCYEPGEGVVKPI